MEITKRSGYRHFDAQEQIQMGLDLENSHAIMSLLRNNIYSDPLTSFVREVYSNAVDAHTRAGNRRDAIDVSIGEDEKGLPQFIVRDYGDSMDKEKIKSVYAVLGKSDKTGGNEEIGGWGIGAASPLAYTDHFWIETWTQEGEKRFYRKWAQYIDSTRVGAIALVSEEETTEPCGTKVTVPIKPPDRVHVIKAISLYLFYTKAKHKISGFESNWDPIYYNYLGNNWSMKMTATSVSSYASAGGSGLAVVGGIPYGINFVNVMGYAKTNPIDHLTKPSNAYEREMLPYFAPFLSDIMYYKWRIDLDIGEIDLSASREELQYTDRTNSTIVKALYHMFKEFCEGIKVDLLHESDFTRACFTYGQFYGGAFKRDWMHELKWTRECIGFGDRQNLIRGKNNRHNMYMLQYQLDSQGYGVNRKIILRKDYDSTVSLSQYKVKLFFNDTEFKPNTISKFVKFSMRKSGDDFNLRWMVIDVADKQHLHQWVLETFPQGKVSELVTYYRENYVAPARSGSGVCAGEGEFKSLVYYGSTYRDRADYWGPLFKEHQAPKSPSVPHYYIHQDDVVNSDLDISKYGMSHVTDYLNDYLAAKGISRTRLFYTKKVTKSYSHENWINLFDVIKADLLKYESTKTKFFKMYIVSSVIESDYRGFLRLPTAKLENDNGKYREWLLTLEGAQRYVNSDKVRLALYSLTDSRIRSMFGKSGHNFSGFNSDKLQWLKEFAISAQFVIASIEEYLNRYPLLRATHVHYFRTEQGITEADYIQYVNVMEKHYGDTHTFDIPELSTYSMDDLIKYYQVTLEDQPSEDHQTC